MTLQLSQSALSAFHRRLEKRRIDRDLSGFQRAAVTAGGSDAIGARPKQSWRPRLNDAIADHPGRQEASDALERPTQLLVEEDRQRDHEPDVA